MPRLLPCPGCGHHIRATDATSCPFCTPRAARARRSIAPRTAARAAVGAAALLTAQVAVAQLTPPATASYGAPPGFDDPLQVDVVPTLTTEQDTGDEDDSSEGSGEAPPSAEAPTSVEPESNDPGTDAPPSGEADDPSACGH